MADNETSGAATSWGVGAHLGRPWPQNHHGHLLGDVTDQGNDFRGEQVAGSRGWYSMPVFTRWGERLLARLICAYIMASQRHADARRLTDAAREGLKWMREQADSGRYSVLMDFRPGDMQFVNNYHVLHGRTHYTDDRATGRIRHLKRLWLETEVLHDRPPHFANRARQHWAKRPVISRLDAAH